MKHYEDEETRKAWHEVGNDLLESWEELGIIPRHLSNVDWRTLERERTLNNIFLNF